MPATDDRALQPLIIVDSRNSRDFDDAFPLLLITAAEQVAAHEFLSRELDRRRNLRVIGGVLVPKPTGVRVSAAILLAVLAAVGASAKLHPEPAAVVAAAVIPAICLYLICLWRHELARRPTN